MESFSLYIHILPRSMNFLSYVKKKLWGSKNPENGLFQESHLIKKETYFFCFFSISVADIISYSCLFLKFQVSELKIVIEVIKLTIWPQKCVFLKSL